MLIAPSNNSGQGRLPGADLRAHSPKRAGRLGVGRVKDGLAIGPLRATGGPPSGGLMPADSAGSGGLQRSVQGSNTALLDLPADGQDLVEHLRAQVRSSSPLTAGIASQGHDAQSVPPSMGMLQARQSHSRQRFQQLERQSRFLQTSTHPRRESSGFGFKLFSSTLNLLG